MHSSRNDLRAQPHTEADPPIVPSVSIAEAGPPTKPRLRLESIDTLRALAAMAVVMVHAFEIFGLGLIDVGNPTGNLTDSLSHNIINLLFDWVFHLGGLAVPVFIALSGYSLMIPIARTPTSLRTPGELRTFFYRRFRRIVPPYYAALALSLLLIVLIPGMNTPANVYWDRALRDLDAVNVGAHLLLIHNGSASWRDSINPPLWSMAVEWQIYFLFPLLVILWRRAGLIPMIIVAAIYSLIPRFAPIVLLPFSHINLVLLFALGMAGATMTFGSGPIERALRDRLPWALLGVLGLGAFLALHIARQLLGIEGGEILLELTITGGVMALLIASARSQLEQRHSALDRALSTPALARIGLFSYSLYLVHLPILALLALLARNLQLPVTAAYLLVILAGLPLSLVIAYGFHVVFERPFMTMPRPAQTEQQTATN